MDLAELRRLFDLYVSADDMLLNLMSSACKDHGHGYLEDIMEAMSLHDAGLFPEEFWPEDSE